jgi:hypothetical protein
LQTGCQGIFSAERCLNSHSRDALSSLTNIRA